jgi:N-acetylmuramoyl-L-alanine amidase
MKYLFLLAILALVHCRAWTQNALLGRTTGLLPYLEYGPGDDRLGGAKMTYLDSNILMQVVDSTGDDYKVKLSEAHTAFLPKRNFSPDTSARLQPYYLTGSWRVYGDERYDYVTIGLPEKLPYRSRQELRPSRIVVDIFGAVSNTNWITQLQSVKEIRNVWYEQVEDDVFRVFIELRNQQHWGCATYYNKNVLNIRVKRQPPLSMRKLRVAIDAGHGGSSTGATGVNSKIQEKDYTLKIAKQLERYLKRKGVEVYMTRTEDVDVGMIERTQMLRERDPDLLLSIHLNSSGNKTVKGVSTITATLDFVLCRNTYWTGCWNWSWRTLATLVPLIFR